MSDLVRVMTIALTLAAGMPALLIALNLRYANVLRTFTSPPRFPRHPTLGKTVFQSRAIARSPAHSISRSNEPLLVNRFQLLIDHFTRKAIDSDVQPVTLFTFDDKVSEPVRCWWIAS